MVSPYTNGNKYIKNCKYKGEYADGSIICEHVPFHEEITMKNNNLHICINPKLIVGI